MPCDVNVMPILQVGRLGRLRSNLPELLFFFWMFCIYLARVIQSLELGPWPVSHLDWTPQGQAQVSSGTGAATSSVGS